MNICLLVGKNLPKFWLGDGTEELRTGETAWLTKTSQPRSFESPVAHSVLEMLPQFLHPYFSTGRIRDPSLLAAQQHPCATA